MSTAEARALARVGLANYYAGALVMPYRRFLDAAEAQDLSQIQALLPEVQQKIQAFQQAATVSP